MAEVYHNRYRRSGMSAAVCFRAALFALLVACLLSSACQGADEPEYRVTEGMSSGAIVRYEVPGDWINRGSTNQPIVSAELRAGAISMWILASGSAATSLTEVEAALQRRAEIGRWVIEGREVISAAGLEGVLIRGHDPRAGQYFRRGALYDPVGAGVFSWKIEFSATSRELLEEHAAALDHALETLDIEWR